MELDLGEISGFVHFLLFRIDAAIGSTISITRRKIEVLERCKYSYITFPIVMQYNYIENKYTSWHVL